MLRTTLIAAVLVMPMTACGAESVSRPVESRAKNSVDARAIARAIESRLEEGAPIRVKVACPREVEWVAGKTFTCLVKDAGNRSRAVVVLGDARDDTGGPSAGSGRTTQGEYSWRLR